MTLFERSWDLDVGLLEGQGFDPDSIRVHASVELDEDMRRLALLAKEATLSAPAVDDLRILCEQRNRQHWGQYSAA